MIPGSTFTMTLLSTLPAGSAVTAHDPGVLGSATTDKVFGGRPQVIGR